MTAGVLVFTAAGAILVAVLPRRWAIVPVLLAAAYTTRIPVLELGPANLSALRTIVLIGIVRVLARGERMANGAGAVDRGVFAWAAFMFGISIFHTPDAWTFRGGLLLGEVGVYVLCRVFVRDLDDVRWLFKMISIALAPLATLMIVEKIAAYNAFAIMGGSGAINIREGHVRAYGPFAHSILAGTVGATVVPMALSLWRRQRAAALTGLYSGGGIVIASTSSGPIMMVLFTCLGLLIWHVRARLTAIRWGVLAAMIALQMVMNDPVYFLMARIDITGGSTGWHRAQLIRSSIDHLSEWWATGTDYTRHWMPTGIHANEIHTDITNHFLAMGVMGGLPLLILFVLVLVSAFRAVGRALAEHDGRSPEQAFLVWTLGAMLFGHVMNFWSISLFDQSITFMYLVLATTGAALARPVVAASKSPARAAGRTLGGPVRPAAALR